MIRRFFKKLRWRRLSRVLGLLVLIYVVVLTYRSIQTFQLTNAELKQENINDPESYYHFTFGHVKEKAAIQQDDQLVYYVDYSKIKSLGMDNGKVYNPVTIGLNALRSFQKHTYTGEEHHQKVFLANADWLVKNINAQGAWEIHQDVHIGKHTIKAPWISGLAQGLAMSVLVRAYKITGNQQYLTTAELAMKPLEKDISQGGVQTQNDFGVWYEEYPLVGAPTHVFNGFMYSLFGLYDLHSIGGNERAKAKFDEGIRSLENALPLFDLNCWSKYSLNQESNLKNHWNYCSPWYQKLHTCQLQSLSEIANSETLKRYSTKFAEQRDESWVNLIIYPAYIAYTDLVFIIRSLN